MWRKRRSLVRRQCGLHPSRPTRRPHARLLFIIYLRQRVSPATAPLQERVPCVCVHCIDVEFFVKQRPRTHYNIITTPGRHAHDTTWAQHRLADGKYYFTPEMRYYILFACHGRPRERAEWHFFLLFILLQQSFSLRKKAVARSSKQN